MNASPRRGDSQSGASEGLRVLAVCTLLGVAPTRAAEPGIGQPYPISRGPIVRVANHHELQRAIAEANASTPRTLLLADGHYTLGAESLVIRCRGLVIRGASGHRDRVLVTGPDVGPNATLPNVFVIESNDVVIADLTLGRCRFHGIQVRGESPYDVAGLHVRNCHLIDCNEQFIKGSSAETDPAGATDGIIEGCTFEFTRGWAYQYYTGGIDIHKGVNWVVRDNLFRNLRVPANRDGMAEHAIHFWKRCPTQPQNILIERNRILNCDRGIGLGLVNADGGFHGGQSVIRNNLVHNDGAGPRTDVGIGLEHASGVNVDHNTVIIPSYWAPIEYRFPGSSNVVFRNNLVNRSIQRRDDAPTAPSTGNLEHILPTWFRDLAQGDLRLTAAAQPALDQATPIPGLTTDAYQQPRPQGTGPDIGATEFAPPK